MAAMHTNDLFPLIYHVLLSDIRAGKMADWHGNCMHARLFREASLSLEAYQKWHKQTACRAKMAGNSSEI